jgi:hypothetical protein
MIDRLPNVEYKALCCFGKYIESNMFCKFTFNCLHF